MEFRNTIAYRNNYSLMLMRKPRLRDIIFCSAIWFGDQHLSGLFPFKLLLFADFDKNVIFFTVKRIIQ